MMTPPGEDPDFSITPEARARFRGVLSQIKRDPRLSAAFNLTMSALYAAFHRFHQLQCDAGCSKRFQAFIDGERGGDLEGEK